jgi:CRP-like cAMP-binding protein
MHDRATVFPSVFPSAKEPSVIDLLSSPSLKAKRRTVAAGTVLCEPDEPSTNLYFVESGQVRVYQIGPDACGRLLEILGPNDWFGIAALAQHPRQGSRAVAVAQSVVWEVPAEGLLAALPTQPLAAVDLVKQLAAKFQNAVDEAGELVFDDCNLRLLKTLVRFSSSAAATQQEDGVVLRITHDQLAQAVGVARETVSLALTQLRNQNLLRTGRNQLFFKPETLRDFARKHGPEHEGAENGQA